SRSPVESLLLRPLTRPCCWRTRGGTVRSGTRWRAVRVRWRPSRQRDPISGVNSRQVVFLEPADKSEEASAHRPLATASPPSAVTGPLERLRQPPLRTTLHATNGNGIWQRIT